MGVGGLLSLSSRFESVVAGVQAALTSADPSDSVGPQWFPPVVPRECIERSQYGESFPHLLGTVHALDGGDAADGDSGGSGGGGGLTDVVLAPAACYPVYVGLADRVLSEPVFFDAAGFCYRHEATSELGRFRSFRQREFVVVGAEGFVAQWRDAWIARGEAFFARLGLTVTVEPANDPFFGPTARLMRVSQLQQSLKYEFIARLYDDDPGTAISSANSHKDRLGRRFGIRLGDDGPAHSSCIGFGLERIALALIHAHGDDPADWPDLV
jgi:seryl-tRNA synthetase